MNRSPDESGAGETAVLKPDSLSLSHLSIASQNEPSEQEWAQADAEFRERKRRHLWPLVQKIPVEKSWLPALVYGVISILSVLGWYHGRSEWTISRHTFYEQHEVWRALLACFAHADFVHLLANAPLFIVFGTLLYGYFGLVAFPLLAFVAGALANAATVLLYAPQTELLGASGVNYAMVGMWLVYFLARATAYKTSHRVMRAMAFALVILIPNTYEPRVSYAAHGFGFAFGVLLALFALRWLHDKPRDDCSSKQV